MTDSSARPVTKLSERLLQLRVENGMSRAQLCKLMGVSRPSVWGWETDGTIPHNRSLKKLAQIYGVSISTLTGDEDRWSHRADVDPLILSEWRVITDDILNEPAENNLEDTLAERLIRLRKATHTSRAQLSRQTGVSVPSLWAWETGRTSPNQHSLQILAHHHGVSVQQLTGEDADPVRQARAERLILSEWRVIAKLRSTDPAESLRILLLAARRSIAELAAVDVDDVKISIKR